MSVGFDHFEQSFIAGQYECDRNGRMKAGAIMSQCQSISTNHCNEVGLTIDVYRKTHSVFLLAKVSLELYGDIRVGDCIRMLTQPSSPNRAVYDRYTQFWNEQGQEVAAQDSKWVLVDTDSRKILRNTPEEFHFPMDLHTGLEQDFTIPKVKDAPVIATERVTYSRTDDNGTVCRYYSGQPAVRGNRRAADEEAGHQLPQRGKDGGEPFDCRQAFGARGGRPSGRAALLCQRQERGGQNLLRELGHL